MTEVAAIFLGGPRRLGNAARSRLPRFALLAVTLLPYGFGCSDGSSSSTPTTPSPTSPTPTPTPPAPVPIPEGLRVSAVGSSFIEFEWASVEGATEYEIQLSLNADSFDIVTSQIVSTGTKHQFEVGRETRGYARVRAGISGRWSDYSPTVTGISLAGPPANLRVASTGSEFIEFEWDPVEDVVGYDIEMSRQRDDFTSAQSVTTTDTKHRFSTAPDTEGFARIRAVFMAGKSNWSDSVHGVSDPAGCASYARKLLVDMGPALVGTSQGPTTWNLNSHMSNWDYVTVDESECVTELKFDDSGVRGIIPRGLGDLSELRELHFDDTGVTGEIPSELGQLRKLTTLRIVNSWYIRVTGGEVRVTNGGIIHGSIPEEIADLTSLEYLAVIGQDLEGSIPSEFENLANLEFLYLVANGLDGVIPSELGNLTRLEILGLHGNDLEGQIPHEIGNLTQLGFLHLGANDLEGNIPPNFGNLTRLETLGLYGNNLTGRIPGYLSRISTLTRLDLKHNNLTGCVPAGLPEIGILADIDTGEVLPSVNPQWGPTTLPPCNSSSHVRSPRSTERGSSPKRILGDFETESRTGRSRAHRSSR